MAVGDLRREASDGVEPAEMRSLQVAGSVAAMRRADGVARSFRRHRRLRGEAAARTWRGLSSCSVLTTVEHYLSRWTTEAPG